ncbi:hypothetical protein KJ365_09955 [Glaciecola sp. XM2]|jgi:hypothetical protein|uniref:hypothetical protein n=1 Tax=Glaciecola sp. XM2 TaxID=1914931 RepID=UPI001BDEDDE0|nr:hypothetical protein [Glaciecola sp. XM2]MBT1451202.1 hypothetical protein [Glaciecola sp. XM2]
MNLSYLQIDHERTRDRSMFNLTRFLYLGGSQFKSQYFRKKVEEGKLGEPLMLREPLLQKFKEEAESRLARGDSYVSVKNIVGAIRSLYQFIDTHNLIASEDTLQSNFLQWAAWLDRVSSSKRNRKMSGNTAHGIASRLSGFIGSTFEIPYGERFIFKTRLTKTVHAKRATGRLAEKQNLEESFLFGRFIYALATGINRDTLCDSKPKVIVPFKHLSRTIDLTFEKNFVSSNLSKCKKYRIINCRIDAELLLFVSQTGMMPGEALKLRRTTYKYKPLGDEYEVREYKNRKSGEVFFFIHKEYRKHFQNYVEFITEFMPEGDCVFSTYQFNSVVSVIDNYRGERINLLCKE